MRVGDTTVAGCSCGCHVAWPSLRHVWLRITARFLLVWLVFVVVAYALIRLGRMVEP